MKNKKAWILLIKSKRGWSPYGDRNVVVEGEEIRLNKRKYSSDYFWCYPKLIGAILLYAGRVSSDDQLAIARVEIIEENGFSGWGNDDDYKVYARHIKVEKITEIKWGLFERIKRLTGYKRYDYQA